MFEELYYWMYTQLSKIKSNDNPPQNAYFLIGILQTLNIGTFLIVINYYAKIQFAKHAYIYLGISSTIILGLLDHYILYAKREKIFSKYESLSAKRRKKGLVFFWLYVLLSNILFFVAAAYLVTPHYK
jgi:hypothetical protein